MGKKRGDRGEGQEGRDNCCCLKHTQLWPPMATWRYFCIHHMNPVNSLNWCNAVSMMNRAFNWETS